MYLSEVIQMRSGKFDMAGVVRLSAAQRTILDSLSTVCWCPWSMKPSFACLKVLDPLMTSTLAWNWGPISPWVHSHLQTSLVWTHVSPSCAPSMKGLVTQSTDHALFWCNMLMQDGWVAKVVVGFTNTTRPCDEIVYIYSWLQKKTKQRNMNINNFSVDVIKEPLVLEISRELQCVDLSRIYIHIESVVGVFPICQYGNYSCSSLVPLSSPWLISPVVLRTLRLSFLKKTVLLLFVVQSSQLDTMN